MTRKGMSQTLALIVAASVLMMTALTVIFMVQGGLGDVMAGITSGSCSSTLEAKCANEPDSTSVTAPGSCYGDNGQAKPSAPSYLSTEDERIQCGEVTGR
ncbi:MAG: hypothetical protein BRC27_00500 [Nanohaloarchaea archaeon SW_10_44_10]|nr:MAG: hypothetical protein BRC27_00500 [Nanohaloarchaea archaeon SW_10_44_10]